MQEKSEKLIDGPVIETPSSDASIIRKINSLRRDVSGVNGTEIEAKVEVFKPKLFSRHNEVLPRPQDKTVPLRSLTHADSALGHSMVIERNSKKAA